MKTINKKSLITGMLLLSAFALWTVAVCFVDVQSIGPEGSEVGFATLNGFVHNLVGVNMTLYAITDWLGLVPFGFVAGFGLLGLTQWICRKKLTKVDGSILVLGVFYIVVMGAYLLFEVVEINYRPVLLAGVLETSYPSSTTMLVLCVIPTAILHLRSRIPNRVLGWMVSVCLGLFMLFMVAGRVISGVHWCSDIIGGVLLSSGLVMLYTAFDKL